jgi:hypothetical protein
MAAITSYIWTVRFQGQQESIANGDLPYRNARSSSRADSSKARVLCIAGAGRECARLPLIGCYADPSVSQASSP